MSHVFTGIVCAGVIAALLPWSYAFKVRKAKEKEIDGRGESDQVCVVQFWNDFACTCWLGIHLHPSGCIPCVPLACTITCWRTFLERSLTWFTWKSWACVGTRWWFALSVTWPTTPRAFRNWLGAPLKLAMFPMLPATCQRILSATWVWPAIVPILNAGVSSSSLLCFLMGFLSLWLAVSVLAQSVRCVVASKF